MRIDFIPIKGVMKYGKTSTGRSPNFDIATVIAAPWAAGLLADFGAEVIKIEMTGRGDAFRAMGPLKEEKVFGGLLWGEIRKVLPWIFTKNKAKKIFLKLVQRSDVVIENFKTGTLDKWGIGVDEMKK